MQVQNKLNAMIFEMVIENFKGIEVFAYVFKKGEPLVVYGDNGAGKTAIILALWAAIDKRKIPIKYDSLVGPYSIEAIKKAKIKLGIEGDIGILELNGKTLEKFYVNFSITEKGSVNLTLTDAKTGEVDKSPSKEKVKNLLGLFLDPVDLANTLEEPNGDRKMAEKLAAMVGLDLNPYVMREETLFQEKQEEKITLKNLRGEFAKLDVPQDDWAKVYVDPASISAELQKLNEFNTKENEKKLAIETASKEHQTLIDENQKLASELKSSLTEKENSKTEFIKQNQNNVFSKNKLDSFKEQSRPDGWENSESVLKVEEEIIKLTEKAKLFRKFDQDISDKENAIKIGSDREESLKKISCEKREAYNEKLQKNNDKDQLEYIKKLEVEKVTEENKPIDWTGEKDHEGIKTPLQFLTDKMSTVEFKNDQVKNRKKYNDDEEGIELVVTSIKDIDAKRNQNTDEKLKAISSVDFPMEGITVDENTVWYDSDDGRGKQTILDRSEGERMRVCTHVLIAGNTGPLNVIVVRQGHALSQKSQEVIFEVAAEYGYTVILETIIAERPGSVLIEAGNVKSVIPAKMQTVKEANESIEDQDPDINW